MSKGKQTVPMWEQVLQGQVQRLTVQLTGKSSPLEGSGLGEGEEECRRGQRKKGLSGL